MKKPQHVTCQNTAQKTPENSQAASDMDTLRIGLTMKNTLKKEPNLPQEIGDCTKRGCKMSRVYMCNTDTNWNGMTMTTCLHIEPKGLKRADLGFRGCTNGLCQPTREYS